MYYGNTVITVTGVIAVSTDYAVTKTVTNTAKAMIAGPCNPPRRPQKRDLQALEASAL